MSRLDRDAIVAALAERLSAVPDPDGVADLVASQGRIVVAGAAPEIGPAIDRMRPLEGYRWLAINRRGPVRGQPEDDRHQGGHHGSVRTGPEGGRPAAQEMSVSTTTAPYDAYRRGDEPIPSRVLAWNVYGTGIERVGRDGRPELVDVPRPGPDQLVVRVDAVGLCFSDVKLIRLGGDHPKLYGRDLEREPTRVGHEASVTVMAVGERLADRYRSGQRLAIQPDIYVNGRSTAYGYTIPGGLIEYHVMGPEVLAADDGAYVIPVDDRLGYAEAALTEPWACVEAAYTQRRRLSPKRGGRMLIAERPGDARTYDFGGVLVADEILMAGVSPAVEAAVRAAAPPGTPISRRRRGGRGRRLRRRRHAGPALGRRVSRAADALAFRGLLNLVADEPLDGDVEIDVGRLHYHYTAYVGTTGTRVAAAYGETRNRAELRPGGVTVVVGAAGPMGQMHIERALSLPSGPRLVVAVDLDAERLGAARERLAPVARARGRALVFEQLGSAPGALEAVVARHAEGGADDVVVTAPSAAAVISGARAMAGDGMLVLFAGVPVGTRAALDLSPVFLRWRPVHRHLRLADRRPGAGGREDPGRPARAAPRAGGRGRARGGAGESAGAGRGSLPGQDRRLPRAARSAADPDRRAGRVPSGCRRRARRRWRVDDGGRGPPLRPSSAARPGTVIVTVTPNPSVDRTLIIRPLARGELIRVRSTSSEAGGKGINVSAALTAQGHPTLAVVPLSRRSLATFRALLREATPIDPVTIAGELRTNISLVEEDGTVTKVNEAGPMLTDREADAILDRAAAHAASATWVVGSGSLPPGAGLDLYARLVRRVGVSALVAIDADGDALRAAIEERPALVKPNRDELEELAGRALRTLGEAIEAARSLVAGGVGAVLVSLGPDGAIYVDADGASHAEARLDDVRNTVGAGDALLAGFLAAGAAADGLGEAVAWSLAACRSPGTRMGPILAADREAVTVHSSADAERRLAA